MPSGTKETCRKTYSLVNMFLDKCACSHTCFDDIRTQKLWTLLHETQGFLLHKNFLLVIHKS
jgi:hypothetical protein